MTGTAPNARGGLLAALPVSTKVTISLDVAVLIDGEVVGPDTQHKAMDDTLQQHRETLVDLRGTLEKAELELEPMMKQDQPNEGQILSQIDKVAQARAELEKANARFLLAIRSKLTPDQWKQMQAVRESHMHGDWGKGGGPGTPGLNGRERWQHRGDAPPPPDGQAAPPAGPQSMRDEGSDGPPLPQPGAAQ